MTLTTTTLSDFAVTIVPAAQQAKADAIALAKSISTVTTTTEQANAIAAASLMKGLLRDVEKARVSVKAPVLDAERKIDAVAKAFATDLDAEVKRVERLAADFQKEEDRKAAAIRAEEERRQQAQRDAEETERQKEKEALARLAAEADKERLAALLKIQQAESEAELEEAQANADRLAEARAEEARNIQQACQEAERARQDAMRERFESAKLTTVAKPAGAVVKRSFDYELKDIRALYAARPDLVELSPRRSLILAAISIPNAPAIPGLYVFEETKVQSKAS